ncbi:hypothetical protein Vadar_013153 [Vaccinium darrowii]|uniref:Uncharacterized protein n=1 Tax=Vaccinium darrowii TaxID=229202 RepID=A0ACB7YD64_9ERIC|nr:hypothetical protein Vadar_013153 [Vaccinium darrowii]
MYALESENKDAKLFNCVQVFAPFFSYSISCFGFSSFRLFVLVNGHDRRVFLVDDRWQRGHQNSVEMMPIFFMLMIVGGIIHPKICASLGVVYILGRYFFFTGYATGDPQNRLSLGTSPKSKQAKLRPDKTESLKLRSSVW